MRGYRRLDLLGESCHAGGLVGADIATVPFAVLKNS
jgi:hypothetical protein